MTGKKERLVIRDTRSLVRLLYRDLDASRAVLKTLLEEIRLYPIKGGVELRIRGIFANLVKEQAAPSSADGTAVGSRGSAGRI